MSEEISASVLSELQRIADGSATLEDLAEALSSVEQLFVIVPSGEFSRFMQDLDAAVEEKGYGNVKIGDATAPKADGFTNDEGLFVPRFFTNSDWAREFAVTSGIIQPDDNMGMMAAGTASKLWEVLANAWGGAVLDAGTDHQIVMNRRQVGRVYAVMTLEDFARQEHLHALYRDGALNLDPTKDTPGVQAYTYSDARMAEFAIERVIEKGKGYETRERPTLELLQEVLGAGVRFLLVDPALPPERFYTGEELERMVRLLDGEVAAAPAGARDIDPALDVSAGVAEQAHDPTAGAAADILADARRFPTRAMVPPPGRGDAASQEHFQSLRARLNDKTIEIWEYVDSLAFDLDLWVPAHPKVFDGLRWPQLFGHPEEEGKTILFTFCQEGLFHRFLGSESEQPLEGRHVSGLEALRWVWAAPKSIDEVSINLYQGTDGWVAFPNTWALSAIYPQFVSIESLDLVAKVGLGRLGKLPGARGLKPEVVKALVNGWRQLVGVASAVVVDHDGGRYIPVFSNADSFFAYDSANPGSGLSPVAAGDEPPFGRWLRAGWDLDGVVLDPGGPWPLTLDATDLLVLSLWADSGGSQPHGTEIVKEVVRLWQEADMPDRVAGRIAADWPRFFVGAYQAPDGQVQVMTVPDRDCCAMFTTMERAEVFMAGPKKAGALPEEMRPIPVLNRWHNALFQQLDTLYEEGGWIDPQPMDMGISALAANVGGEGNFFPGLIMEDYAGLHLHGEMLDAAIERVDERLKPRVPGFVHHG